MTITAVHLAYVTSVTVVYLQFFIGEVDAELLEIVGLEVFEAENIEDRHGANSAGGGGTLPPIPATHVTYVRYVTYAT